jgi:hypothetical protein
MKTFKRFQNLPVKILEPGARIKMSDAGFHTLQHGQHIVRDGQVHMTKETYDFLAGVVEPE